MPNLFKSFLKPAVDRYVFPDAEDIPVEEAPPPGEEDSPAEETPSAPEEAGPAEPESGAQALLTYARVQAEQILADARRQAAELEEQLRRQIREEGEAAREESRTEGYRQGYAEGLQQARVEGQARLEEQLRQEADAFQAALQAATQAREDLIDREREELCDLSLAIAEKVIHISLKSSRQVVARMIQVATEKLKRREWVHIYVGGCEARDLGQITPELTAALSGLSDHIKIIPMADDELGTCIIEMPDEIIDASASTQLDNIRDLLHDR